MVRLVMARSLVPGRIFTPGLGNDDHLPISGKGGCSAVVQITLGPQNLKIRIVGRGQNISIGPVLQLSPHDLDSIEVEYHANVGLVLINPPSS